MWAIPPVFFFFFNLVKSSDRSADRSRGPSPTEFTVYFLVCEQISLSSEVARPERVSRAVKHSTTVTTI